MAVGAARSKNSQTVLTNHVIFVSLSALIFLFIGYKLVFNASGGLFGYAAEGPSFKEADMQSLEFQ